MGAVHDRRSLAAEALATGRPAVARSFRLHRPRGAFCGRGYCGLCKVAGGTLACETAAAGASLRRRDPLRPLGLVAERFPPWFYERGSLRSRPALHLLRRLSAAARVPAAAAVASPKEWREEHVETAVVGDSGNVGGLVVGVYEHRTLGVVRDEALVALSFDRLVLATGTYDVPPPVPGNDLPGVVGLGALAEYAAQGALRPGVRIAVWGAPGRAERAAALASAHGAAVVWSDALPPARIEGRARVRAVDGVPCDLLVSAVAQPALELAAQAGAAVRLAATGLPVLVATELPDWLELRGAAAAAASDVPAVDVRGDSFVCLCEDVRARDVRRAIAGGFDHPELVKRRTGAMTGPCQGKLCAATVLGLLREAGKPCEPAVSRPPSRPPTLAELAARA